MTSFADLKTASKLRLSFGIIIFFLLIVTLVGAYVIVNLQLAMNSLLTEEFTHAKQITTVKAEMNAIRGITFKVMLVQDRAQQAVDEKELNERLQVVYGNLNDLKQHLAGSETHTKSIHELDAQVHGWHEARKTQVLPMMASGDQIQLLSVLLGDQTTRIEAIRALADQLNKDLEDEVVRVVRESNWSTITALVIFASVSLLVFIVAAIVTSMLTRSLAQPLTQLTTAAARIANFDLLVDVPISEGKDEIAVLVRTFKIMLDNLGAMSTNIGSGVNVLAASSNEILASIQQVAAGAAETASALTETTTTVEEVRQTAQVSNEKAKNVSRSAQRASELGGTGSKTMQELGAGMHRIQGQMNAISESIARLSEQSHSIGAIIASVEDITEQSNILAVNASIEAAKAGEHGKGFAVVAQEVRSLAEQSREATKQVRQILSEIQKGVTSSGMVTEQGSRAVLEGIQQSQDALQAVQALLASVEESSHAALQITTSSQQQLVGMEQIAIAMESIRDASTQNVAATRQVEEATRSLSSVGSTLRELIAKYRA